MKSKKLFAILTLVAFMMTLVPMAAFGAEGNRYASTFEVDKTSLVADGVEYVKATIYIATAGGPQSNEQVIVATNRGAIDTITWDNTLYGAGAYPVTDANGKVVVKVASTVKGTAKLAAAVDFNPNAGLGATEAGHVGLIQAYLNGSTTNTVDQLMIIGTPAEITFTSPAANAVVLGADATPAMVANGTNEKTITATVTGAGGSPVAGEVVTFAVNKTGLTFDKTEYKTDAMGIATAKVTTTKATTYDVTATAGGKTSAAVTYTFAADVTPYALNFEKEPTSTIATGAAATNLVKIKVTDINGNRIAGAAITPTVKTKPADSSAAAPAANGFDTNNNSQFNFTPDKVGDYVLRFALANGKFVETKVTAAKQGTVTKLTIAYDEASLIIPAALPANATAAPTVKQLDADGVSKAAAGALVYSSSNPAVATVAANGVVSTATIDAKDAQDVTITVVDTTNNLVASTVIKLVGQPVAVKATTAAATAAVNAKVTFTLEFVDKNGNVVALGANPTAYDYTVTSKPAGAGIDVAYAANRNADFNDTGKSTVTVSSTVAGKVEVALRITAGGQVYVVPVTATFDAPKVVVGAQTVTMFIGTAAYMQDATAKVSDVAPFIKDGRTFVAVRPVADAFGAQIGWNEATQTVTLTRSDITVTIVIGSNALTVVKNGVTSTVTADVPAFIKDGRTVLPFRAVGEAFGATVNFDAATQAVTYVQ